MPVSVSEYNANMTCIHALAVKYVCIIMLCTYETHSGYYNTALNQNLFLLSFMIHWSELHCLLIFCSNTLVGLIL
jgi:hypothetical protein